MAQFYLELKVLRESRGISLEELESRTKINIRYLRAIEKGEFDVIEVPYLRLFLRAYAEEIGGDSVNALEQLDSFNGTVKKPLQMVQEELKDDVPGYPSQDANEKKNSSFQTDQKLRQDIIKGSVLLLIFIFAIVIFRSIFTEESSAQLGPASTNSASVESTISESIILAKYRAIASSNAMVQVEPPFFITIQSSEQINILFSFDNGASQTITLFAGVNKTLPPFVESANILFPKSLGVTTLINGISPGKIDEQEHPVRLEIINAPPSVKITHYAPSFN